MLSYQAGCNGYHSTAALAVCRVCPAMSMYVIASAIPTRAAELHAANHALTGCCSEFKHQVLLHNPALLDAFLSKTAASSCDFDKVSCVFALVPRQPSGT